LVLKLCVLIFLSFDICADGIIPLVKILKILRHNLVSGNVFYLVGTFVWSVFHVCQRQFPDISLNNVDIQYSNLTLNDLRTRSGAFSTILRRDRPRRVFFRLTSGVALTSHILEIGDRLGVGQSYNFCS